MSHCENASNCNYEKIQRLSEFHGTHKWVTSYLLLFEIFFML